MKYIISSHDFYFLFRIVLKDLKEFKRARRVKTVRDAPSAADGV